MPATQRKPTDRELAGVPALKTRHLDLTAEAADIQLLTVQVTPATEADPGVVSVPASLLDWKADAVELFDDRKYRSAITAQVADDPAAVKLVTNRLTMRQLMALVDEIMEMDGLTPGEDDGSPSSSRSVEAS